MPAKIIPKQIADPTNSAPIGAVMTITGPGGQVGFAELSVVLSANDTLTFNPPLVSVPGDAPAGVYLSTPQVSAIGGDDATFSLVNDIGLIQIGNTGNVETGPIRQDSSLGGEWEQKIRADFNSNKNAIEMTVTLTVSEPIGHAAPSFDAHFVANSFYGCFANDFLQTQPDGKTEYDSQGIGRVFAANQLRQTDLGVHVSSEIVVYALPHALAPANFPFNVPGGSTTTYAGDDTLAVDIFPHPAKLSTNSANLGYVKLVPDFTGFAVGDWVTVQTAWKRSDAVDVGFYISAKWGATHEAFSFPNVTNPTSTNPVNSVTFGSVGVHMSVISYTYDATTGICKASVNFQLQDLATEFDVGLTSDDARIYSIVLAGAQITKGLTEQPWRPTGNAQESTVADNLSITNGTAPGNVLHGATGWFLIETQDFKYNATDLGLVGDLVRVGPTDTLRITAATRYSANGVEKKVGYGGFCGITRAVITWDGTGMIAAVNHSGDDTVVVQQAGQLAHAGTIQLLQSLTGRIRRVQGGIVKLSLAEVTEKSSIRNRPFLRPGDAQVPGMELTVPAPVHQTLYDGFTTDPILKRTVWPGGTIEGTVMAGLFNADKLANPNRWLIPRSFYYGHDPKGSAAGEVINQEMEAYVDEAWQRLDSPTHAAHIPPVAFQQGSDLVLQAYDTHDPAWPNLAALVIEDLANPGNPQQFISSILTSFTFWSQQFGDFESVIKVAEGAGFWSAWWIYAVQQQEVDILEQYNISPNQITGAVHATSFSNNNGYAKNLPGQIAKDYHSFGFRWRPSAQGYSWYLDGKQTKFCAQNEGPGKDMADMDNFPMFMLFNLAVNRDQATNGGNLAALKAICQANDGRSQMRVDRVQVHQYGVA